MRMMIKHSSSKESPKAQKKYLMMIFHRNIVQSWFRKAQNKFNLNKNKKGKNQKNQSKMSYIRLNPKLKEQEDVCFAIKIVIKDGKVYYRTNTKHFQP